MEHATHLVLVGPMGAGKSVVGCRLAARLGLPFVDLDAAIEADAGADIPALFAREGEAGFREREHRMLAATLGQPRQVVATGGGAVLDPRNRALLRTHALVAWLRADPATQWQRLSGCTDRPLLSSPDPAATLRTLARERGPLYRQVADLVLDTDGLDEDAVADALESMLRSRSRPGMPA